MKCYINVIDVFWQSLDNTERGQGGFGSTGKNWTSEIERYAKEANRKRQLIKNSARVFNSKRVSIVLKNTDLILLGKKNLHEFLLTLITLIFCA
jgi:hypothetical protein